MSEDNKRTAVTALADEPVGKRGYTLDELRYQRALKELQKDFCKEKLTNACRETMVAAPWNRKSGGGGFPTSLLGSVMKGLSYADYFILGFSVFKTLRKTFSFFRRKKQ